MKKSTLFNGAVIARSIVKTLVDQGAIDQAMSTKAVKAISQRLEARFSEIGAIQILQEQFSYQEPTHPRAPFHKNGNWMSYLKTHYADALKKGYLPIHEISDPELRKSLAHGKAQNRLPKDLNEICLTKGEVLKKRREAIATLLGIPKEYIGHEPYMSFVGSMRPQYP